MLTSLEMTILGYLAGIGSLMLVYGVLLALVVFLWTAARIGNAESMDKLL